jgi:hypothetical protein
MAATVPTFMLLQKNVDTRLAVITNPTGPAKPI